MPEKKQSWEDAFEEKMKKLEKRMDEIGRTVEEKGEAFGKRMEEKATTIGKEFKTKSQDKHSIFWGIALLIVGIIWLGNNLGWFDYHVSWLPILMIAGGAYLIWKNWKKEANEEEG